MSWGTAAKATAKAAPVVLKAGELVLRHAQRLWNNLTPEERAEFFRLIRPKNGKPFETKVVTFQKRRVQISKEDGKLLPVRVVKSGDGETVEVRVPIPRLKAITDLSDEEIERLKFLIRKANNGVG